MVTQTGSYRHQHKWCVPVGGASIGRGTSLDTAAFVTTRLMGSRHFCPVHCVHKDSAIIYQWAVTRLLSGNK